MNTECTEEHKTRILNEATESLAKIIDSTSPLCDLSAVIVKAIANGDVDHVTINY